jgi:hypothetical protein
MAESNQTFFVTERTMVARLLLLCTGLALLPANVWAQAAPADQPLTRADFDKLNANITALTQSIDRIAANTAIDIAELRKEIQMLKDQQQTIIDQQKDQGTILGQITMQGEAGAYHIRFDTNSQSGRDELKRAIDSTVPSLGTFVVKNKTPNHQYIVVNGEEPRHVWPYDEVTYRVKPGAVTSKILGQQTYTWHVGVPDFKRVIELVETKEPTIPRTSTY